MYNAGSDFYSKTLDGSLRFNDNDSAYLSRTPSTAGNRKTWTWSGWVKRGNITNNYQILFGATTSGTAMVYIGITNENNLRFISQSTGFRNSSAVLRDVSAWYHIVVKFDSTQATASDRVKMWLNGEELTDFPGSVDPTLNQELNISNTVEHVHGIWSPNKTLYHLDGYMSEVHFTDGTAYDADAFGEFKSGVWVAKEPSVTYGTNGFYLPLSSDSNDNSGNGNNWTQSNLASTDFVLDSPTNNFATLNVLGNKNASEGLPTFSQGNLQGSVNGARWCESNIYTGSGKWYYEVQISADPNTMSPWIGVHNNNDYLYYSWNAGNLGNGSGVTATGKATLGVGSVVGVAIDANSESVEFFANGVSQGTVTASTSGTDYRAKMFFSGGGTVTYVANFGQDSSFAGNKTPQGNTDDNGIGDFYYAPPTGYLALCTANLPEPVFSPANNKSPQDHFNTVLWTGNGTSQSIDVGFQPDFVWHKTRSTVDNHVLLDLIRGEDQLLYSNLTNLEGSRANSISLTSTGFDLEDNWATRNGSGITYVAWNWKAGGAGVSNTDGSITSTVSANVDAGFSIATFTPSGAFTVGHGLNSAPELLIVKSTGADGNWLVYSSELGNTKYLTLDTANAALTNTNLWQSTSPTTSVWSGNGFGSYEYVAYCFHSVDGFSKFGSYTGNGSTDGTFVYTGFKPAFVIVKRFNTTGDWFMFDNKRAENNSADERLVSNETLAESTGLDAFDFVSNGLKLRDTNGAWNGNGDSYIYMAFAENPFKYANAR